MFRLGAQADKGLRVPQFPTIAVHNARRGFFERDQFEKVLAELPDCNRWRPSPIGQDGARANCCAWSADR